MFCKQRPPLSSRPIFPDLSYVADKGVENFVVALGPSPVLTPGFDLPHSARTCPGNISLFLLDSSFLHLFPVWFLSVFELNQEFPVQQAGLLPACSPALQMIFLHFVQVVIEV